MVLTKVLNTRPYYLINKNPIYVFPNGKRGYFHHELFTAKTTQRNEKKFGGDHTYQDTW